VEYRAVVNIRDLSTLERTAHWLDELIEACHPRGSSPPQTLTW